MRACLLPTGRRPLSSKREWISKYVLRRLAKNPVFFAAACISLALGIGANTAAFSVVHAVLLRSLPVKIGNSRVMVNDVMMGQKGPQALGGSPAHFWLYVENSDALFNRAVHAGAKVFKQMAASAPR